MTIKPEGMSAVSLLIYIRGWLIQGLSEEVMCRGFLMTSIAAGSITRCYFLEKF